MSSVTGQSPRKSLHKRLVALEKTEFVAATTSQTASELHVDAFLTITAGGGVTFTLPADADDLQILVGHGGVVVQGGAGAITHTAGSGATLLNNAATAKTNGSDAVTYWKKVAANTYRIWGDLAAS